jgi:transposase-like protein
MIRLSEEDAEELLRLRLEHDASWEQLAEDEGCDAAELEAAIRAWSGSGDLVIGAAPPRERPVAPPHPNARRLRQRYQRWLRSPHVVEAVEAALARHRAAVQREEERRDDADE